MKFPSRQVALIINKKISFTMLSVWVCFSCGVKHLSNTWGLLSFGYIIRDHPHLLHTRVPRAYCKFRSEFFSFFFSALIRGASAKPIVWSWFLTCNYRQRNYAHSPQSFQRPSINLCRRWFNDHHISKK